MDTARAQAVISPALRQFAMRLHEKIAAEHIYLFLGGCAFEPEDIDQDLIIVSPTFQGVDRRAREVGLRDMWYDAGGESPLDLICVTPEEFDQAQKQATVLASMLPESVDLLVQDC